MPPSANRCQLRGRRPFCTVQGARGQSFRLGSLDLSIRAATPTLRPARFGTLNCPRGRRSESLGDKAHPMKTIFSFLILPLLVGCASDRVTEGPVGLGQMAYVSGPRVRADSVIEDSRCPVDVQCVQAGRLVVRATVLGGGWSKQVDLTLGVPVDIADGKLTLAEATPSRRAEGQGRESPAYRFTFKFEGGL